MFNNLGLGEMAIILVLGLFVFGPERLPRVIGDVMRAFRQLRAQASTITDDLRSELDPHLAELRDLDPRASVRDAVEGPGGQRIGSTAIRAPGQRPPRLAAGEVPPYDPDAT